MILQIPDVLSGPHLNEIRHKLESAKWTNGDLQETALISELGAVVTAAVQNVPRFLSAALPVKLFPPQFHRYPAKQTMDSRTSHPIRSIPGSTERIRTDLAAMLFLSEPDDYEGGELLVDSYGSQRLKLPAGHLLLYPATGHFTLQKVSKGMAYCAVFWAQSMIRDDAQRKILFDLDSAIQQLSTEQPDHPSTIRLAGVYQDLLRYWART